MTVASAPEGFERIFETIDKMPLTEFMSFIKAFESHFGVTAEAPQSVAPAEVLYVPPSEIIEQTEFTVTLTAIGPTKIALIKAVRELTGLGLKDAKDLVDVAAIKPVIIRADLDVLEAHNIAERIRAEGGEVEIS